MSVWYYHCQHVSLFVEDTFDVRIDDKENKTPIQQIISNSSNRGESIYWLVFSRNSILANESWSTNHNSPIFLEAANISSIRTVHCKWGDFGKWSKCSVTCGEGMQTGIRSILRRPRNGGRRCRGSKFMVRPCNDAECSTDYITTSSSPVQRNGTKGNRNTGSIKVIGTKWVA